MSKEAGGLFNSAEGQRLKEEGMEASAAKHFTDLQLAQVIAKDIAKMRINRTCNADDVFRELEKYGITTIGNAAGAIFKGGDWEWTGRIVESTRTSNHRRCIKVWRLK